MARKDWAPIIRRASDIVESYDTAVTLRQVHYRLVVEAEINGSGYLNTENDYKNLSRLSAAARRAGTFPPLLDRVRGIERALSYYDPLHGLESLAYAYRRDLLDTQETLPLLVVEKVTLIAQLMAWFGPLCVPAVALRGYASETLERHVRELLDYDHRDVRGLYLGDFDPSGQDIPRTFVENTGLTTRRVALTAEQVDRYALPPAPGKASDSRASGFEEHHGVRIELEALAPTDLRDMLKAEIDLLVDDRLVSVEREREETERRLLAELAHSWDATYAV